MTAFAQRRDAANLFAPAAVFARVAERISSDLSADALDRTVVPEAGDHTLNDWPITADFLASARVAAVLVALIPRADGIHVLLTRRTADLRDHAGQVAFPGGKMDPDDATPAHTACREAFEEVGLAAGRIAPLGYLGAYLTRTGFRIIPVVARVDPPFALALNPAEVVETFEVPFAHLMSEANHSLRQREWKGLPRHFYAIEYGDHTVWGITAAIIRLLYERLYGP